MNGTLFNEIDSKAISNLKNEIKQNNILIDALEKKIKLQETNFDKATEFCSIINDLQKNIKDFEQKVLLITFKYF